MSRIPKDYKDIHIKLSTQIYEELEQYCMDVNETKTDAIENILDTAIKNYYMKIKDERKPY